MRITKNQLRQIIKEELAGVLEGAEDLYVGPSPKPSDEQKAKDAPAVSQKVLGVSDEDQALADAAIAARNKNKSQTATEKPPAKVDESRRRKVRKTRRK